MAYFNTSGSSGSGVSSSVSVTSSVLPTNASTSALQTTGNTALSNIIYGSSWSSGTTFQVNYWVIQ